MRQLLFIASLIVGLVVGMIGHATAQAAPSSSNSQPVTSVPPAPASGSAQPAATAPPAQPEEKYVVPAGTKVLLSLKSALNTKTARPGDGVYLVSTFPVVIGGHILIPDGVYVQGVVDRVERPGKVKGRAQISLHFTTFIFPNGQIIAIPGTLNRVPGSSGAKLKGSEGTLEQDSSKGHDAGTVLQGAGIGAGIGTIGGAASGNWGEGMGYGALGGAAAGAISTLFTRGNDINIPEGASVEMIMQRPMELAPQQYAVVDDLQRQHMKQQFAPVSQAEPLKKPDHQLPCSADGVGCN